MKYIMKDGKFVCKENGSEEVEVLETLSGTLAGIRVISPEGAPQKLQIDLKDESGDEPVVRTLNLRLYADPALKILSCLYGIAEIISGKVISITMEEREGRSSLISVYADGELLPQCGQWEAYAYDKKLYTDKVFGVLKRCFEFKKTVLVYANADGEYPGSGNYLDTEGVCSYIRELRNSGRSGELTVIKTTFTDPGTAKGYLKAIRDLMVTRSFRFTDNETAINAIWSAYTDELPEETTGGDDPASAVIDDNEEC